MADRVAVPGSDIRGKMRAPIERNDARVVNRFHDNYYVTGALKNLVITGEGTGARHRHAKRDATLKRSHLFRIFGSVTQVGCYCSRSSSALPLRRIGRNFPSRRIDNERRAVVEVPVKKEGQACRVFILELVDIRQGG